MEKDKIPSPAGSVSVEKHTHQETEPTQSTSSQTVDITASKVTSPAMPSPNFVGPESFRGFPKAEKRRETKGGRKRGKSCVPTDTPVKEAIRERSLQREGKKGQKRASKKLFESESEDEDTVVPLASSDDEDWMPQVGDESSNWAERPTPIEGDYVLVKFSGKHSVFYVGKVENGKDADGDYDVKFLRKGRKNTNDFLFPQEPDIASVPECDIVMILPQPTSLAKTKRRNACLKFEVNLSNYDIR